MEGGNEAVKDQDKERRHREKSDSRRLVGSTSCRPHFSFIFSFASLSLSLSFLCSFYLSASQSRSRHWLCCLHVCVCVYVCVWACVAMPGLVISVLMLVRWVSVCPFVPARPRCKANETPAARLSRVHPANTKKKTLRVSHNQHTGLIYYWRLTDFSPPQLQKNSNF